MTRTEMVDCIVKAIASEAEDTGKYMEMAASARTTTLKSMFTEIAKDEQKHREHLVDALATMAKEEHNSDLK